MKCPAVSVRQSDHRASRGRQGRNAKMCMADGKNLDGVLAEDRILQGTAARL